MGTFSPPFTIQWNEFINLRQHKKIPIVRSTFTDSQSTMKAYIDYESIQFEEENSSFYIQYVKDKDCVKEILHNKQRDFIITNFLDQEVDFKEIISFWCKQLHVVFSGQLENCIESRETEQFLKRIIDKNEVLKNEFPFLRLKDDHTKNLCMKIEKNGNYYIYSVWGKYKKEARAFEEVKDIVQEFSKAIENEKLRTLIN